MESVVIRNEEVPQALRAWLDAHDSARLLVELIVLEDGSLGMRILPGVDPAFVERALVTMAKYREALMNLT